MSDVTSSLPTLPVLPDREGERLTLLYDAAARIGAATGGGVTAENDRARVLVELSREIRLSHAQIESQLTARVRLQMGADAEEAAAEGKGDE